MARPNHLTRGDVRFLAGVTREPIAQLDDIAELGEEVCRAAERAGVEPDLAALLELDDPATIDDPHALAAIRAGLRSQLGRLERGEVARRDARAEEDAEMLREARQLREDIEAAIDEPPTEEPSDEYDDE